MDSNSFAGSLHACLHALLKGFICLSYYPEGFWLAILFCRVNWSNEHLSSNYGESVFIPPEFVLISLQLLWRWKCQPGAYIIVRLSMISSSSFPARVPDFYAWFLKYRRIFCYKLLSYIACSQIWLTFTVDHSHFGYIKNFSGSCTHGIWLWSLCLQTLKGRNKGLWALKESNLEENNAYLEHGPRLQLGAFCVCMCFFWIVFPW
jgi:hypothetical protein